MLNSSLQSIGILSPSSSINREKFEAGLSILKQRGFKLTIHPQTYIGADTGNQYAGSPDQKAKAFMDLWMSPDIDLVMASCGGNFSSQFLHLLDFEKIAAHPKQLMGFSDTTALLSALYARTGIGGIFGPTVQTLGRIDHLDHVFDILTSPQNSWIDLSGCTPPSSIQPPYQSPVFAATLSVLMSLAGTPYFPNLSGHILILEDIGEELSHLDRTLWQLNQICPFRNLNALIFGDFVDIKDTGRPLGLDFKNMIQKFGHALNIPIFMNAPVGHGNNLMPIPLGRLGDIDVSGKPRLIFT